MKRLGVFVGLSPFPGIMAIEGLSESPTKNVIILVVTTTGKGAGPRCLYLWGICLLCSNELKTKSTRTVTNLLLRIN